MRFGCSTCSRIVVGCVMTHAAVALADDILDHVPSDCAAVIVIRDYSATSAKLDRIGNRFARALGQDPSESPINSSLINLHMLGVDPRWCDPHAPVVFMLMQANLDEPRVAVGFTRAHKRRFASLGVPDEKGSRVRRLREGDGSQGYGTRFDDFVFISTKRLTLERIGRQPTAGSLGHELNAAQQSVLKSSDVWLHARIKPWMPQVEKGLDQASMFLKLMNSMRPSNADLTNSVFEWLLDSVKSIFSQMRCTDLALRLDDDGVSLTHLHLFDAEGTVSQYLAGSTVSPGDCLADLPDRPFMVAWGSNWRAKESLWAHMFDRLCMTPEMKKKIAAADREELRKTLQQWYEEIHGAAFLFGVGPEGGLPAEMAMVYRCADASKAMKHFTSMQSTTQELMGFLPGGNISGRFKTVELDGIKAQEMAMDLAKADANTRLGIELMYGHTPRFVVTQAGAHKLVCSLSSRQEALPELVNGLTKSKGLTEKPEIRALRTKLPANPHMLVIVDLGQTLSMAPQFAQMGAGQGGSRGNRHISPGRSAYLGWAMTMDQHSVRGQAYISFDDAIRLTRMVRSMQSEQPMAAKTSTQPSR